MSLSFSYFAARVAGRLRPRRRGPRPSPEAPACVLSGISVVIPSRNGQELLALQLPGIAAQLEAQTAASEIIVVDNGSGDGTAQWLQREWPSVAMEVAPRPLSFARAVNRGVARARFSHVCLLNNDMLLDPGFFSALMAAFRYTPGLFCATAQIRFPAGARREETGKAVMAASSPADFPIRCDEPLAGEDQTWVLYGSGGCSLYDAAKLRALGGVDEAYAPAYVEDLDLGYRAWQRGWPSVYVAGAEVEHRHRATTSRYFREEELAAILEINYLKFLARAVASPRLFGKLWNEALRRLRLAGCSGRDGVASCGRYRVVRAPFRDHGRRNAISGPDGWLGGVFPGGIFRRGAGYGHRRRSASYNRARGWLRVGCAQRPVGDPFTGVACNLPRSGPGAESRGLACSSIREPAQVEHLTLVRKFISSPTYSRTTVPSRSRLPFDEGVCDPHSYVPVGSSSQWYSSS